MDDGIHESRLIAKLRSIDSRYGINCVQVIANEFICDVGVARQSCFYLVFS